MKKGDGKMIYNNGEEYKGNWINDKRKGKGIMKYNYGNEIYDGKWKNDMKNGKGKIDYNNNKIFVCVIK